MNPYGKPDVVDANHECVGIAGSKIRVQLGPEVFYLVTPETALRLSRNLMRMALILEPPAETKAEEKP